MTSIKETTVTDAARPNRMAKLLIVPVLLVAFFAATAAPAGALTVRTGARWDHMDILLTRAETQSAARGVAGAIGPCRVVVGAATAAGFKAGPKGAILSAFVSGSICVSAVATCAAQANRFGQRAGITVSPAWHGVRYWCWRY